MRAKKKQMRKRVSTKTDPPIPSLSSGDFRNLVARTDRQTEQFWNAVENIWDWTEIREGGKLFDRIRTLDRHFVKRGKTHKVCPIVILLNAGPN
jgi:hypothetical protein